jgi:pimeloyl-ACP methyl ester carboxylesterase
MIHGRSQEHKDPMVLQQQWEEALRQGVATAKLQPLQNVKIAFPFYGDELDRLVQQLNAPLMRQVAARGGGVDAKELQFKAEFYTELAIGWGISDRQIESHYEGAAREKGPLNWKWVQAILKALDRTPLGDAAIDQFTRDVYVYLTYPAIWRAVNRIVADKLTDGRWVVVAHSLGTVVGYNVLRDVNRQQNTKVTRYITVGSPLGVQAIRKRLELPLTMPACVDTWYNAFDPRDVVSLYPLDGATFPIQPPITNNNTVKNHTDNRHGVAGYLDDANVARQIAEAVQM